MEKNVALPGDPLPYNSPFYIQRPPLEKDAYTELNQPGGLLLIRGSRKMGKSSLMLRLIHQAQTQGYSRVNIDFRLADHHIFSNTNKLLRWICMNIAHQLSLPANINEYWDEDIGSKISVSIYLEAYLLEKIEPPLVLILDEVNNIFEHQQIAQDFLSLLRSWHEQSKHSQIWQKLRLVIIHSTELYVPLQVHQSPFNVGLSLNISLFNYDQVTELAQKHQLTWFNDSAIEQLMQLVGGHPYLIHLGLYHLHKQDISLSELIQTAISYNSIYASHLQYLLKMLQISPELPQAYNQIINSQNTSNIPNILVSRLDTLGLIKKTKSGQIQPACEMYRLFFKKENTEYIDNYSHVVKKLEKENERLKRLANIDTLTQIPNRRYFDDIFQTEWERMMQLQEPLSLILLDIDKFKLFNDTYGHPAGDDCLRQFAQLIRPLVKRQPDVFARYGGEEFVIMLPGTDAKGAVILAETIREKIKITEITIMNLVPAQPEIITTNITISLGVAAIIPSEDVDLQEFFVAADQALYQAKNMGRNRSVISSKFSYYQSIMTSES